jgi:chromate transporter
MFFRIGLFGFGGGLAMLPLIFQGVQEFGIMSTQEFSDLVALSQVTPGPVAVNAATYVGFNFAGFPGAIVATLGVTIPSFLIMLIVANFVNRFYYTWPIRGIFTGIRPVTAGLIGAASVMVAETTLFNSHIFSEEFFLNIANSINPIPCLIFLVSFFFVAKMRVSPIFIILGMGLIGAFVCG